MLCPRCGKEVGGAVRFCDSCRTEVAREQRDIPTLEYERGGTGKYRSRGPTSSHRRSGSRESRISQLYELSSLKAGGQAGFWLRAIAAVIDSAMIGILQKAFNSITEHAGIPVTRHIVDFLQTNLSVVLQSLTPLFAERLLIISVVWLHFVIFGWLYYAILESTPLQATIGKIIVGIKVTDSYRQRLGFLHASGRHFAKILSTIPCCFGFLMAGFTAEKQALHDKVANTNVVRTTHIYGTRIFLALAVAIFALAVQSYIELAMSDKTRPVMPSTGTFRN